MVEFIHHILHDHIKERDLTEVTNVARQVAVVTLPTRQVCICRASATFHMYKPTSLVCNNYFVSLFCVTIDFFFKKKTARISEESGADNLQ